MANRGRQGLVTFVADNTSVRSISSEDVSYAGVRGQCCVKASNPAYKRGRRLQLLQMLVLPFIPILALIVQTAIALRDILTYRQEVSDIEAQVCYRYEKLLTYLLTYLHTYLHSYLLTHLLTCSMEQSPY